MGIVREKLTVGFRWPNGGPNHASQGGTDGYHWVLEG